MPGLIGIISRKPVERWQHVVEAMVRSMEYEPSCTSGKCFVPEFGIYVGWTAHEDSIYQVFFNESQDITLVLSGECFEDADLLYNLRRKGHKLETGNDWLVHLYEEEDEQFVEKLNGLFSGLLIDRRRGKAFLFNDRYGAERIYWHQTEDAMYFASEAKALLCVRPELRKFDDEGIAQFLTYGCTLEGRTVFHGIQQLPAASVWSFEGGNCQRRTYFSPKEWESQPSLSTEVFQSVLNETFRRVLPRYFESHGKIGISLTGGLDSRMIMACRPDTVQSPVCYTFSGESGETIDDRLASAVAKVCGLEHVLLRIGPDFFTDFGSYVDQTVYVTDGCLGATGAHEIYLNRKARQFAPVRLTGNYGSEVFRGVSTFGALKLAPDLFSKELNSALNVAAPLLATPTIHPVTFAAFREIPWNLFGCLAASRSQVTFRTPYLDNELVALAYQAPRALRKSPVPARHILKANKAALSKIPTDRKPSPDSSVLARIVRRVFCEATFKLDYLNNEGWPDWLSPFDSIFTRVTSGLKIVGLHKYLHYRTWFRKEFSRYIRDAITEAQKWQTQFWNRDFLKQMVEDHTTGRKNYVHEINAVLTLEAVERLLFRGFPEKIERETKPVTRLSSNNISGNHQVNRPEKPKLDSAKVQHSDGCPRS